VRGGVLEQHPPDRKPSTRTQRPPQLLGTDARIDPMERCCRDGEVKRAVGQTGILQRGDFNLKICVGQGSQQKRCKRRVRLDARDGCAQ
jgi:hypothetical protein